MINIIWFLWYFCSINYVYIFYTIKFFYIINKNFCNFIKMKNIIFDVDDTLYDLMEPFQKAHEELMEERTDAECEELFKASRTYSDEAFYMAREGKIAKDEEFAYRIQKTYRSRRRCKQRRSKEI